MASEVLRSPWRLARESSRDRVFDTTFDDLCAQGGQGTMARCEQVIHMAEQACISCENSQGERRMISGRCQNGLMQLTRHQASMPDDASQACYSCFTRIGLSRLDVVGAARDTALVAIGKGMEMIAEAAAGTPNAFGLLCTNFKKKKRPCL